MQKIGFPGGSLLAAMFGEAAPLEAKRAVRRLRAESAPALMIDDEVAGLALGLADTEPGRSAAVLAVVPPLFWLEARRAGGIDGWVVETKRDGLAVRGFGIDAGAQAVPEPGGALLVRFGVAGLAEEDAPTRYLRGLLTAASLPELLSQMGESSPIMLLAADAPAQDASVLRGLKLLVAIPPDAAPG
ncbi:MAG: hypothetical protein EON55_23025 [Alphaproteobacteria bacterium]|nr:MAG: hypothetical protein EON55_23025 [Alphaproteobacteria bacterium]